MADFEKQVSLIEIDVDVTKAKKDVEEFTRSIIDQTQSVKNNTTQIKTLEKANKDLQGEVKKGNKTQKEANDERRKNLKSINNLKVSSAALKDGLKDLNKERTNAVKVTKLQGNSLNALRKRSVDLKKSLNAQETATKSGAKAFDKLQSEVKETKDKIRELDQGAGDFTTTVGKYPQQLDAATGGFGAMAKGMGAMIKQSLIFLATPLGLILGAVALAVMAVKAAFEGSEEGQNKWNKIMGVIGVTIGNLVDLLADFGEFIIEAFENPQQAIEDFANLIKQNIINRFEGLMELIPQLGKAIELLFKGKFGEAAEVAGNAVIKVSLGIDDFTGKVKAAAKATQDFFDVTVSESKKAIQVADDRAKADLLARKLLVDRAKIESEIAQLRLKSRQEEQFGAEERKESLIEAQALEENLLSREKEVLSLRANAMTMENTFSRSTKENLDAEAAAIAAVSQIEAARFNQQRSTQRELNRLNKEITAENNKELKKRAAGQQRLNDKLEELAQFRLQKERDEALLSAETDQEKFALKRGLAAEDFNLRTEKIQEEEEILAENKTLSEQERAIAQAEIDLSKEQLESDHQNTLTLIDREAEKERLDNTKRTQQEIGKLTRQGQQAVTSAFAIAANAVEKRFNKRQANLRGELERGEITDEEFARKTEDLEKRKANTLFKIELKKFKVQKAIDLANAGVAIGLGISRAIALGPPAAFILAPIIGALGAVQLTAIATKQPPQAPQFAQGGDVFGMTVGGNRHSAGGTKYTGEDGNVFEVEKDEGIFVTKREATNPALMLLDQANTMNGGNSMFSDSGRFLQQGGEVDTGGDLEAQAELVVTAVAALPPPVIEVSSFMAGINAERESTEVGTI